MIKEGSKATSAVNTTRIPSRRASLRMCTRRSTRARTAYPQRQPHRKDAQPEPTLVVPPSSNGSSAYVPATQTLSRGR